ncbi:hypothetical protein [Oerskovia jenensis]|uniref:hypothetical protein n=1 Tax=Oerskovia jenensis TaxID=162169 RepID=UPI0036D7CCE4
MRDEAGRLRAELARMTARPAEAGPACLMLFEIDVVGDRELYAQRLRQVLVSAVRTVIEAGVEGDRVDVSRVPSWFEGLSEGSASSTDVPVEALAGRRAYVERREQSGWDLQEWIYCFDPDLRRWSWWDVTAGDGSTALLWVDTSGETVVPCEELWWTMFVCGARSVAVSTQGARDERTDRASIGLGLGEEL